MSNRIRPRRRVHVVGGTDGPTAIYVAGRISRKTLTSWGYSGFVQRVSIGLIVLWFFRLVRRMTRR